MLKREYLNKIKELVADNTEYVEFLDGEIARLDARAAKGKDARAKKNAEDGEAIRAAVVATLEDAGRAITLPELAGGVEGYTPAKVIYHIRPLVEAGTIVKEKAKVDGRKIMTYRLG